MSFALNQPVVNGNWSSGNLLIPYGQNVGKGDLLVMCAIGNWTSGDEISVSDSQGNLWADAVNTNFEGTQQVTIWWASAKSSAANTITIVPAAGNTMVEAIIYDFSGFNGGAKIDQTTSPGVSGSSISANTNFAPEVCVAGFYCNGAGTGGNWNFLITDNTNLVEYTITTSSGTQTATYTGGNLGDGGALATFYLPNTTIQFTDAIFFGIT